MEDDKEFAVLRFHAGAPYEVRKTAKLSCHIKMTFSDHIMLYPHSSYKFL